MKSISKYIETITIRFGAIARKRDYYSEICYLTRLSHLMFDKHDGLTGIINMKNYLHDGLTTFYHTKTTYGINASRIYYKQSEIYYKKGNKLRQTKYNSTGHVMTKYKYHNGKLNGETYHYYSGSKIRQINHYLNDILYGKSTEYDENGLIKSEENYLNGERHGISKKYINGILCKECLYHKDELIKVIYEFELP